MIKKVSLNAKVVCIDGLVGELISVVINPETGLITHLVVQDATFQQVVEWLVPIDKVSDSLSDVVKLNCTRAEVSQMKPFKQEHYLEHEVAEFGYAYSQPTLMAPLNLTNILVEDLLIPVEDALLNRGADVIVTDGYVGKIGELLIDQKSGRISHIILRRGHLLGKKEIIIPISFIHHIEAETIHLNITKEKLSELPLIPLNRPWKEVDASDLDLMIWSFKEIGVEDKALKSLAKLEKVKQITFLFLALMIKGVDGKVTLKVSKEIDSRPGIVTGAIAGGLTGLLIGPGGMLIGAAGGAIAGVQLAKQVEIGVSNEKLKSFQEEMRCGTSAIILIVEHRWYGTVRQALSCFEHEFIHQRLSDIGAQETFKPGIG